MKAPEIRTVLGLVRVSRSSPCPICGKPDWCGVSTDGAAAICMRTESPTPTRNGGWLHRLRDVTRDWRPPARVHRIRSTPAWLWGEVAVESQQRMTSDWLDRYSDSLGLPRPAGPDALRQLGAGRWDGYGESWLSVPMHDGEGRIVGIRLRDEHGKKLAIKGSSQGLFIGPLQGEILLVAEGPTDATAAICCWPTASVIGRPSCRGAEDDLVQHVSDQDYKTVVLIADRDAPGLAGARHAAESLALVHQDVRVIDTLPAKDVRELVRKMGAAAAGSLLKQNVDGAPPIGIEIIWREGRA